MTLLLWPEELESLLMKVKGEWKDWLKLNFQKLKIMAISPITSWQLDGETMETVTDCYFLGPRSQEILLEEKLWQT